MRPPDPPKPYSMPFLFFATRQDLLAALLEAEQKQAVRYVLAAASETGKTRST